MIKVVTGGLSVNLSVQQLQSNDGFFGSMTFG